jgi:hypothetical protein
MVARNITNKDILANNLKILIARAIVNGLTIQNITNIFEIEQELVEELLLDSSFHATVLQLRACKRYSLIERLGNELEKNIDLYIKIRDCEIYAEPIDRMRAADKLTHMFLSIKQELDIVPRLAALEGKISRNENTSYIDDKMNTYMEGISSTKLDELNEKLSLYGV